MSSTALALWSWVRKGIMPNVNKAEEGVKN